ncbi:hypothetical protein C499_06650 [Halogeometricum borinquense DSM 11551]|uniref:Uncharacterized protein n=2 Tax=Halogeometricum borinquense (strain ATCC 700274 / DSM 11551 / JCM 10706 / KCTC 4070 / PR3) TaxID=469382 RepID=L9UWS5_HALBP|nr:hypothetical protein C499_06650 [Halogeometricum borinquense DSM 11551]
MLPNTDVWSMNTTRRTLLSSCGIGTVALLTGCLGEGNGDANGGDETDDETEGDSDTSPTETGGPELSIVSTDELPDAPVRPAIEVTQKTATESQPPGLKATVTNESDRTLTLGEGRAIVFAYRNDTANNLMLLPAGSDYPVEAGCWRLTEGIAITEEYRMVTLEPGESASQVLELYGAPDTDACLPTGTFRFESPYSVRDESGEEETASFTWGFDISLE